MFGLKVGKLSENILCGFAIRQISQHKTHGNPGSGHARFPTKDFRVAYDVLFPQRWHELMLARFDNKGKSRTR
jgi:hypothetical protein